MSQRDDIEARRADADDLLDRQSPANGAAQSGAQISGIQERIEQTRSDMSETIDELQERLSPSHLKEQVREQVREQYQQAREMIREATIGKVEHMAERVSDTMYETRRTVVDTVAANPIPSALVGIGLVWLWMNRRNASGDRRPDEGSHRGARRYDDFGRRYGSAEWSAYGQPESREEWERGSGAGRTLASKTASAVSGAAGQVQEAASKTASAVSGAAGQIQEAASNLAGKAKATVSGVVDQAQESAGHFVDQAQHQAQRVEERFTSALQENPLAIGAVALALGTAVGLAIPQTRKENEWMGDARDTLVDKAQSVAKDAIDHVQQVAQKVGDEMAGEASPR